MVSFLGSVLVSCDSEKEVEISPYLSKVFEYQYGPGQHAGLALLSDTANIIGNPNNRTSFMYLGGWGGYVIAGFDHEVKNQEGNDLRVYNLKGASPEPAIVWVMEDENANGLPDDHWYELKGNLNDSTTRNYKVTYYKPSGSDTADVCWKDNQGASGKLLPGYGSVHSRGWWWPENTQDSLTLEGSLLPKAYANEAPSGTQFWLVPLDRYVWGYAENNYGTDYNSSLGTNDLDISNAIDDQGNPVVLTQIRFIKIQSAVFQIAGLLNEISPEIKGVEDL